MAGYGGYFLQGLSSGLKSGFNMGQMKWQQNEKKRLQKKQDEMLESATIYNSMVAQLGEDGVYSDDDMMKINTAYMALGYEVKDRVDGTYKAIQAMDKKKVDQNYQWFDMLPSILDGVDPSDATGIIEAIRPNISGEKGLLVFDALAGITKKKNEAAQAPKPEDIWGQAGTLPQDVRPDYLRSKGIDIPQPATAQPTEMDLMAETTKKLDAAYATGNANYFNQMAKSLNVPTTFETYKQKYEKPGAVGEGGVALEKFRVTSLSTLEKYRENALNADSWEDAEKIINDYTEAEYDVSQLGVTKEAWADVKKSDLDNLVAVLNEITAGTPEGRNVKGKKKYSFEINGKAKEQTGEEWYKSVYDSYTALLKLLEKQGVDISQYKKLKPLSEIKKIKWGGLVGGGVETGDLIKIYY